MARERQLAGHHPDAVAVVGAIGGRRLHEGGLGQPRLDREALHQLVVQVVRVVHHREAVALERDGGEHVEQRVREGRHARSPRRVSRSR
jgi:hypothetical protein